MPLLVTSVPNLAQGVSQQPDNLRYPGQCDEQINAWSTVVEGLVKRPNTRWIKEFNSGSSPTNLFTHFVKRSEQNKYCVTVSLGGVGVINLEDGESISVATTTVANNYLGLGTAASLGGVATPLSDLRALTVADYTFLVNKNKTVEKSTDALQKSKAPPNEALIVVKLGDYEKKYDIYVDDKLVPVDSSLAAYHQVSGHTYESGPADQGEKGAHADTAVIAEDLKNCISTNLINATGSITSVTINNQGSGFLGGYSTGLHYLENSADRLKLKLEAVISQSGASSAIVKLGVTNGAITSSSIIQKGSGFNINPSTPATITYKAYRNVNPQYADWQGWELVTASNDFSNLSIYYNPPSSFKTTTNSGSDPIQVASQVTTAVGFSVEVNGSVIKLTNNSSVFSIRAADGLANQGLGVIYREVNNITDLPTSCYNGFGPVKVIGDADIDQDDYYVRFSTKDKRSFGEGSWVETVGYYQDETASGELEVIDTTLNNNTMPVTLVPFFKNGEINEFRLQTPNELLIVKQGSNYYRLDKDHIATNDNKPGVGSDWTEYWTQVSSASQGFLEWELGIYYYGQTETNNKAGWVARGAGDDNTNPFPSFVGKTINDIFFFKNRLGILTDSNVIFSEADEYYNFFRTTTQQLLDSAPIDVGLSHTKVALLKNAIPFQEKLMLFSDNSQFVLRGADILSPKTVAISPVTDYDIADGIEPLNLGSYIYFPFKRGEYAGVLEYFVDNNTEVFEAEEITSQIPKYIPSNIKTMVGSSSENMILIQAEDEPKSVYVYKYFWTNKEKIQSAWMKWTFDDDITGLNFIDSTLYLILNGKALVQTPVENALVDTGLDYTLLLDNRVDGYGLTVSYNEQTNRTTISDLPAGYGATVDNITVFTKGGSERDVKAASGTSVEIEGFIASYVKYNDVKYKCIQTHTSSDSILPTDTAYWTPNDDVPNPPSWNSGILYNDEEYFVVGKPYDMLYRFSNQALKQPTERGGRSASDYTFQSLRNGSIEYADSGHFTVEVTPRFRDTYTYVYNPALLSSISTLDRFTPESGHFRFGIQCRPEEATIEVKSSSALPVKLLAAEFESMVTGRSKRYGA